MLSILLYILAAVFLLYAVFLSQPDMGSPFFLIWYVFAAVCAGTALLIADGPEAFPLPPAILAGIVLTAGLIMILWAGAAIFSAFHKKAPEDLDVLIVLGALVYAHGPSRVLRFRLDAAAEYLRKNPRTRCIVSGGQGSNEPAPEGVIMKRYLVSKGIEEGRITEENRSESTYQNILFSREFCDPENDRIAVVTNDFHLYRSMAMAEKAGFAHVYGLPARSTPIYFPNNFLRECFAIVKDRVIGNI